MSGEYLIRMGRSFSWHDHTGQILSGRAPECVLNLTFHVIFCEGMLTNIYSKVDHIWIWRLINKAGRMGQNVNMSNCIRIPSLSGKSWFCTDSGHITLIFAQCDHTIRPPIPFMNWWFFVYNLNLLGTVAELLWQMCFLCISSTIAKLKQNKNEDESCPNHSSFQNYFQ